MLNKLQAIIKNVIIMVYYLARYLVGVLVLRAGQASLMQRGEDPPEGPTSVLALSHLLGEEVAVGTEGYFEGGPRLWGGALMWSKQH